MTTHDEYALQVLHETKHLTEAQLSKAMSAKRREGQTPLDWLVAEHVISEEDVLGVLAEHFGMPFASIDDDDVDPGMAALLEPDAARKFNAVPLQDDGESVMVGICDPGNFDAQDAIRYSIKKNVEFVIVKTGDIKRLMDKLYPATFDPNATDVGDNLVSYRPAF